MKSFWISSVTRNAVVTLAVLLSAMGVVSNALAGKGKKQAAEDLTNFFVSPQYSKWLVGAVARIATAEEVQAYLSIRSDEEAAGFIEKFWEERDRPAVFPAKKASELFEERAKEADTFFSEGAGLGRRSDRGTVYILYGKPNDIRFEVWPRGPKRTIEIWLYASTVAEGLDGQSPDRSYRFWKDGERTVFYHGPVPRRLDRN